MANPPAPRDPIALSIIEDGPNGKPLAGQSIVLEKDDAPHGQARDEVGFEQGGELRLGDQEGTYYPGRSQPTHFVQQFRPTPPSFHGALRDSLWGEAGHSQKIVDAILAVAGRGRYCTVFWGDYSFVGLLVRPKLEREDEADWRYELGFVVSTIAGTEQQDDAQRSTARTTEVLTDIVAGLQADMAAQRATLEALQIEATTRLSVLKAQDAVEVSLLAVQQAAKSIEAATVGQGKQAVALVKRVDSECAAAMAACKELAQSFGQLQSSAALTVKNSGAAVQFYGVQSDVAIAMLYCRSRLRQMRGEVAARLQKNSQVHRVAPGETLEDIAAQRLGSRGRAAELGLTDRDVVPGQLLELPGA